MTAFEGFVGEKPCTPFMDDESSTNIMAKAFYEKNRSSFKIIESNVSPSNSSRKSERIQCEMIDTALLWIESQKFSLRFISADTMYDVIFITLGKNDNRNTVCV